MAVEPTEMQQARNAREILWELRMTFERHGRLTLLDTLDLRMITGLPEGLINKLLLDLEAAGLVEVIDSGGASSRKLYARAEGYIVWGRKEESDD